MIKVKKNFKVVAILLSFIMVMSMCTSLISKVIAVGENGIIQLNGMTSVGGDGYASYGTPAAPNVEAGRIIGMQNEKGVGDVGTPTNGGGQNKFEYTGLDAGTYIFKAIVNPGYTLNVKVNQQPVEISEINGEDGCFTFEVIVTGGAPVMVDPSFTSSGPNQPGPNDPNQPSPPQQPDPNDPGPVSHQTTYPIIAYFEGINTGVPMNEDGKITLPDGWSTGKVTFKAKVCKVNGVTVPDNGYNIPDKNSSQEIAVRVEGIANVEQLNGTVTGSNDRSYVLFKEGFDECGKATIHIASVEENGPVNTIISIINKDIVYLKAEAPLAMSMSLGSAEVSQAIVTKDVEKSLSIFFGNTEATLKSEGINVDKITKLNNNGDEVTLNNDGSATIKLPSLSKETTTKVKVTILLKDGKTIERTVNIKRTAILLNHDVRENKLQIGYVMNKEYLYNNKVHDDNVFNAYIQVILYKGNTVAGFKQIKVDDEEIVNCLVNGTKYNGQNLPDDGAWSIETFDEKAMKIDLASMEGITKASVFLTNGPISFDSDALPSVEFGIGSGLTIEFGGEK